MKDWTTEELRNRWRTVAKEYAEKAKVVMPLVQKMNNLEKELQVLQEEFIKRGMTTHDEEIG